MFYTLTYVFFFFTCTQHTRTRTRTRARTLAMHNNNNIHAIVRSSVVHPSTMTTPRFSRVRRDDREFH